MEFCSQKVLGLPFIRMTFTKLIRLSEIVFSFENWNC